MRSAPAMSMLVMLAMTIPAGMVIPQTPLPASGDWNISDVTSYNNTTLTVNGNITVESGGKLLLDNVTLTMNCARSGQYGIDVKDGGELQMMRCCVTSPAADIFYTFSISGRAALSHSAIQRVWNDTLVAKGGIEIYNNNVTLNNCTITRCSRYGLYISNADPTVRDCILSQCIIGIKVDSDSRPFINFNKINNCTAGIAVMKTSMPEISWNKLVDCDQGIEAFETSSPTIQYNTLSDIKYNGIWSVHESAAIIRNNTIARCKAGISNSDNSSANITGNILYGMLECGIVTETMQDGRPQISCNTITLEPIFQNMDTYGIKNANISNANITLNKISNFRVGILNFGSCIARIDNNTISNSYMGISNCGSSKPFIIDNGIPGSRNNAIGIINIDDSNATIEHNTIDRNKVGISNNGTSHPTIRDNVISNNTNGIENKERSKSEIRDNTIMNNFNDGILDVENCHPTIECNEIGFNQFNGIENNDNCTPIVTANRIFNNTIFGVVNHQNSSVDMRNNTIFNHSWRAIITSDNSTANISGGSINNNTYGIQAFDHSDATVQDVQLCDNTDFSVWGSVDSTLRLSNNAIFENGRYGVYADERCRISIENCTFADNNVGIYLSTNYSKTISNNTIGGERTEYGIELYRCSPDITNCKILDTKNGMRFLNSSSVVYNMTMENFDHFGFDCDISSSPRLIDSTIVRKDPSLDFNVYNDSHPVVINTVFIDPRDSAYAIEVYVNGTSTVSVWWYIKFNVVDSRQRPLDNANVTFASARQFSAVSDRNGSVSDFLVEGLYCQPNKKDKNIYYKVTIEKDSDRYEVDRNLNISRNWNRIFQYDYAPVVEHVPDLKVVEHQEFELDLSHNISDKDHDTGDIQVVRCHGSETNANVSVGPDGRTLVLNYSGPTDSDVIWFMVTDGIRNVTGNVTVHVSKANSPPRWLGLTSLTLNETESMELYMPNLTKDDEQSFRELSIAVESEYGDKYVKWRDIVYLTLQYPEGVTRDQIILRVNDGNGGFLNVTIAVTILHINKPPVINGTLDICPNEGENCTVILDGRIFDPDGPSMDVTLDCSSNFCNHTGHTLIFKYPEGMRSEDVTITVTDLKGGTTTYPVRILIRETNQPPIVSQIPTLIIEAGTDYHFDLRPYIKDHDLPAQTLVVWTGAQYIIKSGLNLTFSYPRDHPSETRILEFYVTDGIARTNFTIPVKITGTTVKREFISQYGTLIFVLVPLAIIATAAGILVYRRMRYGWYEVRRAFLVNQDGRMLAHYGEKQEADDEMLVSSMLTAVQQFIDEAMKKEHAGDIKEFQYEDMKIAIEKGRKIFLAVFLKGYATDGLRKEMKQIVLGLERKFTKDIADWDGRITDKGFITEAEAKLGSLTKRS